MSPSIRAHLGWAIGLPSAARKPPGRRWGSSPASSTRFFSLFLSITSPHSAPSLCFPYLVQKLAVLFEGLLPILVVMAGFFWLLLSFPLPLFTHSSFDRDAVSHLFSHLLRLSFPHATLSLCTRAGFCDTAWVLWLHQPMGEQGKNQLVGCYFEQEL